MAARRDAEMHAIPVANDRVHAEPAVAGLPLARVLVVADTGHRLPRIAAVTAPEQGRRLHAAPQLLLAAARLERPDVDKRAPVVLGKCRPRLRLFEALPHVRRAQHLHAEERIAARGIQARCAARVDQRRIHGHAGAEGPAQLELPPRLRGLGDEHALLGANGENDSIRHLQPPETAGKIVTTSPAVSVVSMPSRSRTLSVFTNTFRCRRTLPVSSQRLRYKADWLRSRSSSAARTVRAETESCDAPAQYSRS